MDDILLVVALFACLAFGAAIGNVSTNGAWRDDCAAIGYHRVGNDVYQCKKADRAEGEE